MSEYYKLDRVRELADGDEDFIAALAAAFIEEVPEDAQRLRVAVPNKDYAETYQAAHKMKPTVDLFELGVLDKLLVVQDWGKFTQTDNDVTEELQIVLTAVENAVNEITKDFDL